MNTLGKLTNILHYHHISFLMAYEEFLEGNIEYVEYIDELKQRTEAYEALASFKGE